MKLREIFLGFLMGFSVLLILILIFKYPSTPFSIWVATTTTESNAHSTGHTDDLFASSLKNKQLGGLLSSEFDEKSCLSRYQSSLYRKQSAHKPSPYLISKLRQYEALHRRCGPHTEFYNRTLEQLKSNQTTDKATDCDYLVQIPLGGLGNTMLSLASGFLYALLTRRVFLLFNHEQGIADLFCEPFPDVTWLLPLDFPFTNRLKNLRQTSPECFGNALKRSGILSIADPSTLSFLYLHLAYGYDDHNERFFCDQDQIFLQKIPWLILKSHFYFTPSLFSIPSFEQKLDSLFPEKDSVFHFLCRYLFYPVNPVWGFITRYYQANLAKSDEKLGIQIRVFDTGMSYIFFNESRFAFRHVLDTILTCSFNNDLLPKINTNESLITENPKTMAVLLTSLSSGYLEKIRDLYQDQSAVNGDVVRVFQPSQEGWQQTGNRMHNRKAWAEIYLLSLMDKLITSPWSTFGYVAQGLGGLEPWILNKPGQNPACTRAISMEPCFHFPPFRGCTKRGAVASHVRHCEDASSGLKLVHTGTPAVA